jgi:integrase
LRSHLTEITVRSLKPAEKQTKVWDTVTPGFGVLVGKSKSYFVMYGRKRTVKVLGRCETLPLGDARRAAKKLLSKDDEPAVVAAPTFPEALDRFLEAREKTLKPRSYYELKRTLKKHFHWHKPLDKITHNDVAAAIDAIPKLSEASHALKDVKGFFSWCVPRYIAHTPCEGLKPPARYVPRTRLLSDDEVIRIWKAAGELGAYGHMVRLLFLTAQRANQILRLSPEWIDTDKKLITFPAAIMKGNREHVLPYGDFTARFLDIDERPTSYQPKKKAELDKLAGVTDWVLHDARRYFSSTQARLKTPIDITEAILAHISGSRSQIQQIYDLYDRIPEMREAALKFESHVRQHIAEK